MSGDRLGRDVDGQSPYGIFHLPAVGGTFQRLPNLPPAVDEMVGYGTSRSSDDGKFVAFWNQPQNPLDSAQVMQQDLLLYDVEANALKKITNVLPGAKSYPFFSPGSTNRFEISTRGSAFATI